MVNAYSLDSVSYGTPPVYHIPLSLAFQIILESSLPIPVRGPLCFLFTLPRIPNKLPHFTQVSAKCHLFRKSFLYHPVRNNTHLLSLFSTLPCFILCRPKHYHKSCILIFYTFTVSLQLNISSMIKGYIKCLRVCILVLDSLGLNPDFMAPLLLGLQV